MKYLSLLLVFCHVFVLIQPALVFAQNNNDFEMEITLVKQNSLIGSKGAEHEIAAGYLYKIVRGSKIIGSAEVKVVRPTMCGLQMVKSEPNLFPRSGDRLILLKKISSEQKSIFDEMQQQNFAREKLSRTLDEMPINYFVAGREAAEEDYGTAFPGGLFAGFMGGLIGWGIGYAIISSKGADVPTKRLRTITEIQARKDFSAGYIDATKSKRKRTFNSGALMGTMIAVVAILATQNN